VLVGFGTSAPELITSLQAALQGTSGIAYGNVVGSNIANVLLILGITAIIYPITIDERTASFDGPVLLGLTVVFMLFTMMLPLSRPVAALFIAIIVGYVWLSHPGRCRTRRRFGHTRREGGDIRTDYRGVGYGDRTHYRGCGHVAP
jgi:Ca2+/Na+ antiporter